LNDTENLLILDKSFLQAERKQSPKINALNLAGHGFVLTDTLVYELCSGTRDSLWKEAQEKLFAFADSLVVWRHTAALLKLELRLKRPIVTPVDGKLTELTRQSFKTRLAYVPSNLKELTKKPREQREVDSYRALLRTCKVIGLENKPFWLDLRKAISREEDISTLCRLFVNDADRISNLIGRCHGGRDVKELFLPRAEERIKSNWFAYQHARCTLALACVYMSKFGEKDIPGSDFRNTKLDADYVALLHYASGIATNETSGSLSDMCKWIYGNEKKLISTDLTKNS
jgi:hypothetical protein